MLIPCLHGCSYCAQIRNCYGSTLIRNRPRMVESTLANSVTLQFEPRKVRSSFIRLWMTRALSADRDLQEKIKIRLTWNKLLHVVLIFSQVNNIDKSSHEGFYEKNPESLPDTISRIGRKAGSNKQAQGKNGERELNEGPPMPLPVATLNAEAQLLARYANCWHFCQL